MAFGSTRQRHVEVAESFVSSVAFDLREARAAQHKGRCGLAVTYALGAIRSSGAFRAHVVARDYPRKKELSELARADAWESEARAVVRECGRWPDGNELRGRR